MPRPTRVDLAAAAVAFLTGALAAATLELADAALTAERDRRRLARLARAAAEQTSRRSPDDLAAAARELHDDIERAHARRELAAITKEIARSQCARRCLGPADRLPQRYNPYTGAWYDVGQEGDAGERDTPDVGRDTPLEDGRPHVDPERRPCACTLRYAENCDCPPETIASARAVLGKGPRL